MPVWCGERGRGSSRRQLEKGVETEEITETWQPEERCGGEKNKV